jgi:hypothetical protein
MRFPTPVEAEVPGHTGLVTAAGVLVQVLVVQVL